MEVMNAQHKHIKGIQNSLQNLNKDGSDKNTFEHSWLNTWYNMWPIQVHLFKLFEIFFDIVVKAVIYINLRNVA